MYRYFHVVYEEIKYGESRVFGDCIKDEGFATQEELDKAICKKFFSKVSNVMHIEEITEEAFYGQY